MTAGQLMEILAFLPEDEHVMVRVTSDDLREADVVLRGPISFDIDRAEMTVLAGTDGRARPRAELRLRP